jgi:nucleoside-diphosphate-sugar epimerase
MNILITGNMGYIGPVLIKHLSKPNYKLFGFDTGYFANCLAHSYLLPEVNLQKQFFGDVRNFDHSILENIDAVVYLAAISNDPMGKEYEKVTDQINYRAAVDMAQVAKEKGVKRFIFASSCSVYGFAEGSAKTEKDSLNPLTAYAKSKIDAENSLKDIADEDFIITCFRFATACGMSPRLRLDLVLNDFVASALHKKRIDILSDGSPLRPIIDVKDMSRAIEWGLIRDISFEKIQNNFLVLNAGSDQWNYRVIDLAEKVKELIPGIEISINKDALPDKRSYKVDFSKFRKMAPDFQPLSTLESSISELIEGIGHSPLIRDNFRESDYIRLKKISSLVNNQYLSNDLHWIK